jgi:spermidine/putrescine transport system substrate-binding protein
VKRTIVSLNLILALLLAACGGAQPTAPTTADSAAPQGNATAESGFDLAGAAVSEGGTSGHASSANTLNVYNWSTYIAEDTIPNFEKQHNVKVNYDIFESNDDLLAKIQPGNPGYDVIVPSDYMVEIMMKEGLLEPLNKANIPNFKNIAPNFINPPYDPDNIYCVPYQWGTTGIGYSSKAIGEQVTSWETLYKPKTGTRVGFLEDARGTIGSALIYLGHSVNSTDPAEIDEAKNLILAMKDQIVAFAPDSGQDLLNTGEVDAQYEYVGDILQIQNENPDFQYVIPKEGAIIWTDNLCIPKGAPHKELAEKFINYILEPKVGADISNYTFYGSPNQAAIDQKLIDAAALENPAIYPPKEIMDKLQFLKDVGDATLLYDDAWTEIKAATGR